MPACGALAIHRGGDELRSNVDDKPTRNVGFSLELLAGPKDFYAARLSNPACIGRPKGLPRMTEPSAIDAASKRLALALDALAAAVERRHEADRGEQTLDAQLHALGADRSRLASEL